MWDYPPFAALAVGMWVDVKLTKLRGQWDVRVVGFIARDGSPTLIYSERYGYVWVTPAGFINYRPSDGPYPPGTAVRRNLDHDWRGLVEWVAGRDVACRRPDDSIEVVSITDLEAALPTRRPL